MYFDGALYQFGNHSSIALEESVDPCMYIGFVTLPGRKQNLRKSCMQSMRAERVSEAATLFQVSWRQTNELVYLA